MTGSVNSTMQVTQINFPNNDQGGMIPPIANQSSHEFKMKHNSSNQSFHSQKKMPAAHVGMTTIRKPGALGAPSLDNSFNNHHNNWITGGVHSVDKKIVNNIFKH